MNRVRDVLVQALSDLKALSIPHAVIGGLAVSARVEPRMTRDVDVAVAVNSDAEAEQVIFALQDLGYAVEAVVEQVATHRMATARLRPPKENQAGVVLDLLFASSGIEGELVASAEQITIISGTTAPVATIGHLIALKLLAQSDMRPQDAPDLKRLISSATDAELQRAHDAVRLIGQRGFARGRDLERDLRALVQTLKRIS